LGFANYGRLYLVGYLSYYDSFGVWAVVFVVAALDFEEGFDFFLG